MPHINIMTVPPRKREGAVGFGLSLDRLRPGQYTGSFEGGVDFNCDMIRDWGAAAVLSLTDFDAEPAAMPLDELSRAVRERGMLFYNLPIRGGHLPSAAFEKSWETVGKELLAILRRRERVLVHGEGSLERTAMIVGRIHVELGWSWEFAIDALNDISPKLFTIQELRDHVVNAKQGPHQWPLVWLPGSGRS